MEFAQLSKSQIQGQIIKDYRETYYPDRLLTQEELGSKLNSKDARAIRDWESGRVLKIHFYNQRDLRQEIGVPLQLLGTEGPLMPEEVVRLHQRLFALLECGAYISAHATSDLLIKAYQMAGKNDPKMPGFILPAAYHIKGMAASTLINDPRQTFPLYRSMLNAAKELNDVYARALALTHMGDTYRRLGKLNDAHSTLEEAMAIFHDKALTGKNARVLGNAQQLFARVLRKMGKSKEAFEYLEKAKDMANTSPSEAAQDYYLCFCPLSVQSELVRTLMIAKKLNKGFDELDKLTEMAEQAPPRWAIPIKIKEGEFKIRFGRTYDEEEIVKEGKKSLLQGYKLADMHAHLRKKRYARKMLNYQKEIDASRLEDDQILERQFDEIDEKGLTAFRNEDSGEV